MRPIQLWLPKLNCGLEDSASERDALRAFELWRGETMVWLLPEIDRPVRWLQNSDTVLAIPSETRNRITVCHIGRNGHLIGPATELTELRTIPGLLNVWLNTRKLEMMPPSPLICSIPRIRDGRVHFEDGPLQIGPTGMMPISDIGEDGSFEAGWPPPSFRYKSISPQAESLIEYGQLVSDITGGTPIARSLTTNAIGLHIMLRWPRPLCDLVPLSAGMDILHFQSMMRKISELSTKDPRAALTAVRNPMRTFLSEGRTSRGWEWYLPAIEHGGSDEVLFTAEDFNLHAKDLPALKAMPEFQTLLKEPVAIRRAWGPVGLFWALLQDKLEEGEVFSTCQRCGRLNSGKKGKKFCGQQDSETCYSARRASDQRRSRGSRNSKVRVH